MASHLFKITGFCLSIFIASGAQLASSSTLEKITANVFNFQQKLANSGNVQSQYKLGEMYEAGSGVEQNLDQARSWYQQAASTGYAPASNRLTYLEIKAGGYDQDKHANWVAGVVADVDARSHTSMLLLAQMYREGVGVKKDLAAARALLDKLITTGNLSVDREIALVDAEQQANRKRETVLAKERSAEAQRLRALRQARLAQQERQALQAASESAVASIDKAELKQPLQANQVQSSMDKNKRYESAMLKLQAEQKTLSEQQAWAEERD